MWTRLSSSSPFTLFACAFLWCTSALGADLYEPGEAFQLTTGDAELGYQDAAQIGDFLIAQIGSSALSSVNIASKTERWRFTSPTGSIRRMSLRGQKILVEAEHLVLLDGVTGREEWQVPLNCYSEDSCNTRTRILSEDTIVLSGFDGKDSNLLLLDGRGTRLWPNWVEVNQAVSIVATPQYLVVATGMAPYAVLGLDRHSGRVRWRFRPEGTDSPAAGLVSTGGMATAWWSTRTADNVFSINLETGESFSDWYVSRNARATGEFRAGGPGFFYAYRPSSVGGGRLRVWNPRTGDTVWRRRDTDPEPPQLVGDLLFRWERSGSSVALVASSIRDGNEVWRYARSGVREYNADFQAPRVLVRMSGRESIVASLNVLDGRVEGIGFLPKPDTQLTAKMRYSDRHLLLMQGSSLERLEPQRGQQLVVQFTELMENGQAESAKAIYERLRFFVDELPAAAAIYRQLAGRRYQRAGSEVDSRSFEALLPILLQLAGGEMSFYEDFRAFVSYLDKQLKTREIGPRLSGRNRTKVGDLTRRVVELGIRFERKLDDAEDSQTLPAIRDVLMRLSEALLEAGAAADANTALFELWNRGWVDRSDDLQQLIRRTSTDLVKERIPLLNEAVRTGTGSRAALVNVLEVPGVSMIAEDLPSVGAVSEMTTAEISQVLARLKALIR